MQYCNHVRSHGGHSNQGLPPVPFAELYEKAPGDHLGKLIHLGIVKLDDEWTVRLMGSNHKAGPKADGEDGGKSLPFALVMHRKRPQLELSPDLREPGAAALAPPPLPDDDSGSLVVLSK